MHHEEKLLVGPSPCFHPHCAPFPNLRLRFQLRLLPYLRTPLGSGLRLGDKRVTLCTHESVEVPDCFLVLPALPKLHVASEAPATELTTRTFVNRVPPVVHLQDEQALEIDNWLMNLHNHDRRHGDMFKDLDNVCVNNTRLIALQRNRKLQS